MAEHASNTCYADRAWQGGVVVEENVPVARDTYRVRFRCPEIARQIVPGQFVMLRLAGQSDPLLGRPLAMYDVVDDRQAVDVVYLAVGKMTRRLAQLRSGDPLEAWGPLGNGFGAAPGDHLVMVAGGIGQTPFLALAREALGRQQFGDPPREVAARAKQVTLCYGAASADRLACVDDFRAAGVKVHLATDDGSEGYRGPVTEMLAGVVESSAHACRIVCCGPEAMMAAAASIARRLDVPCQVSLETPMACGIGICFSCVAKIRDASGNWDYRRTCVEGPVFNAEDVDFE